MLILQSGIVIISLDLPVNKYNPKDIPVAVLLCHCKAARHYIVDCSRRIICTARLKNNAARATGILYLIPDGLLDHCTNALIDIISPVAATDRHIEIQTGLFAGVIAEKLCKIDCAHSLAHPVRSTLNDVLPLDLCHLHQIRGNNINIKFFLCTYFE